jgi:hypothetical protein
MKPGWTNEEYADPETLLHVILKRLGHSQVMTTASIYAHVATEQEKKTSLTFAKEVE